MLTGTPNRIWGLPAILACGSLLAWILLHHPPGSIKTDLAQPLAVATNWHAFGQTLWLLVFGSLLAASVPYFQTLQSLLRGRGTLGIGTIALVCAVSLAICLTMPVIFSSDVYAYAAYGWMDAHGISPYAHSLLPTDDGLIRAAIWQWSNPLPICVYGPLFVWIAKICDFAGAHYGIAAQLFALRLTSSAGLIACAPLVYAAMSGYRNEERLGAAAGITLNPVALWVAAEGHNDTLVLAIVLMGFIVLRRYGYFAGAFIIAAAAVIKASSLAAAAVLTLYTWRDWSRWVRVLAGIACGVALTVLVARPFESGVTTVLVPHGRYMPQYSVQFIASALLAPLPGAAQFALEGGIAIALVGAGLLMLFGMRRILRGERDGIAWLALGLWFAIPNPYPWYALWILPAAFLCIRKPAAWAIVAASLTIFLRYLPDAGSNTHPELNLAVSIAEFALPAALLLLNGREWMPAPVFEGDSAP